jgi:hypothetical protein
MTLFPAPQASVCKLMSAYVFESRVVIGELFRYKGTRLDYVA